MRSYLPFFNWPYLPLFHSWFIFLLSGLAAYLIVYINEKKAAGSIVPGWLAHGLGNTLSYFVIGFLI